MRGTNIAPLPMFIVLTHPKTGRQVAYGPFRNQLQAADFAHEHYNQTNEPTEVRPVVEPTIYGEEGL